MGNKPIATKLAVIISLLTLWIFDAKAQLLWQAHNPTPKTGNLARMTVGGDGALVAIYNSEPGLAVSYNGTNWSWQRGVNPLMRIGDAAWGNGVWVTTSPSPTAFTNTVIQVSNDLTNWSGVEFNTVRYIPRLTFGNGKFWLVGVTNINPPQTWTSTDGTNWTKLPTSNIPLTTLLSVKWDPTNNVLIGVGAFGVSPPIGRLVTSPDGYNWTIRIDNLTNATLRNVTAANGVAVASGDITTNLYRSTDATNWTRQTVPLDSFNYAQIACDGSTNWVCMDFDGNYLRSTNNAATWTANGNSGWNAPYYVSSIAYRTNDGRWYSSGYMGVVVSTTNFVNPWTNYQKGGLSDFTAIAQGAGRVVTAGSSGAIFSSPEGTNWQAVPSGSTASFYTVRFLNGTFYAFDSSGRVSRSTDGVTFLSSNMAPQNVRDALYDGTKLVGWRGGFTNFLTSTNGVNWTNYTGTVVPATKNGTLYKLPSTNGYLYADGNNSGIFYFCRSLDLTNWTTNIINNYYNGFFHDIVPLNNGFCYAYPGGVLLSTDGFTWKDISLFNGYYPDGGPTVSVTNRIYTTASTPYSGRLIYSDDGTNWNPSPLTADFSPSGGMAVSWLYTGTRLIEAASKGAIGSLTTSLPGSAIVGGGGGLITQHGHPNTLSQRGRVIPATIPMVTDGPTPPNTPSAATQSTAHPKTRPKAKSSTSPASTILPSHIHTAKPPPVPPSKPPPRPTFCSPTQPSPPKSCRAKISATTSNSSPSAPRRRQTHTVLCSSKSSSQFHSDFLNVVVDRCFIRC